jgi:thiamine biosynthesis lipoprotein
MPATLAAPAECRFRAMGTTVHAVVVGGPADLVDRVPARFAALEARWSRFRSDSELCRLNAAAGRPALVGRDTFRLIDAAVRGWHATGGRFDPTVLPALVELGYDEDIDRVRARPAAPPVVTAAAPGCAAIRLDPIVGAVTLPTGTALDLGGIAKGFAADLVCDELLAAGAAGACVNAGGDLRVRGSAPDGTAWVVGVGGRTDVVLALADGAVATSGPGRRRWGHRDACHHLVDPATGRSADAPLRTVTVVAGSAAHAEVLTIAAWLSSAAGPAAAVRAAGATGFAVRSTGETILFPGMRAFLR